VLQSVGNQNFNGAVQSFTVAANGTLSPVVDAFASPGRPAHVLPLSRGGVATANVSRGAVFLSVVLG
jgi:hypothetical protein